LCQWQLARIANRDTDIVFDGVNLPIASDSVDALLLAHTLDRAQQPHQLLRECERVLNDRGKLVLMGFNPMSWWALSHCVFTHSLSQLQFYTPARACDWLCLLGLRPEQIVRYGVGGMATRQTMPPARPLRRFDTR